MVRPPPRGRGNTRNRNPQRTPHSDHSETNSHVTGNKRGDVDRQHAKLQGHQQKPPGKIPPAPKDPPAPTTPKPKKRSWFSSGASVAGGVVRNTPAALSAGMSLYGLYHIGPGGLKNAADAFLHGAENALGGLGHLAHDLEDLGKGAAGLFKNATYVVLATGMAGTLIYLYRMPATK